MSLESHGTNGALLTQGLRPVSLAVLDQRAALTRRFDTKFLFQTSRLTDLLSALDEDWHVLEIDGQRSFRYLTTYYDDDALTSHFDHLKGRRHRFKVRTRRYLSSGEEYLEVKLKTGRGLTDKHRRLREVGAGSGLDEGEQTWLDAIIHRSAQSSPAVWLRPSITLVYSRITLLNSTSGERSTIDLDCTAQRGTEHRVLIGDMAIVEVKSPLPRSATAALLLHGWRVRPVSFSKYCAGLAALDPLVDQRMLQEARRVVRRQPALTR